MQKGCPPLVRHASLLACLLLGGFVLARHFAFTVAHPFDDTVAAVNEANVQSRAGQLNAARAVGDTVTATFSDNRAGNYVRQFLISSNAFRQTAGPFEPSQCLVANPAATLLFSNGSVRELETGSVSALTMQSTDADGKSVIPEQYAVVEVFNGRVRLGNRSSFGFSPLLDASVPEGSMTNRRGSGSSSPALMIQHQGPHPANDNFAPIPLVTFVPQAFRLADQGTARHGWAVLTFDKSGKFHDILVLPTEQGALVTLPLATALESAVQTSFRDERRHRHTVYLAFELLHGMLVMKGAPVVVTPMCCPCAPPPPGVPRTPC